MVIWAPRNFWVMRKDFGVYHFFVFRTRSFTSLIPTIAFSVVSGRWSVSSHI